MDFTPRPSRSVTMGSRKPIKKGGHTQIAGTNGIAAVSSLNDLAWSCVVLSSFSRAMLIMSGTFGLWRAGLISNALFATGVVAVVLVLLGGTTWINGGFWAPDGLYSRFVTHSSG